MNEKEIPAINHSLNVSMRETFPITSRNEPVISKHTDSHKEQEQYFKDCAIQIYISFYYQTRVFFFRFRILFSPIVVVSINL